MQRKLMGLLIVMAGSAFAQTSAPLAEDDPAVWAARATRAASLREQASSMRRAADTQRTQEDAACRKKFFENACKDSARERWIEEINKVRAMEIEAVGLERNQRAHEIAIREKERASSPSRPSLILPQDAGASVPGAGSSAGSRSEAAGDRTQAVPKPQAKPLDSRKRASRKLEEQQEREKNAEQAAARAAQARKDAARYAAHASEHAQREAERKARKAASAAAQSAPR